MPDFIKQLRQEREDKLAQIDLLRHQVAALSTTIELYLPTTASRKIRVGLEPQTTVKTAPKVLGVPVAATQVPVVPVTKRVAKKYSASKKRGVVAYAKKHGVPAAVQQYRSTVFGWLSQARANSGT